MSNQVALNGIIPVLTYSGVRQRVSEVDFYSSWETGTDKREKTQPTAKTNINALISISILV